MINPVLPTQIGFMMFADFLKTCLFVVAKIVKIGNDCLEMCILLKIVIHKE